MKPLPPTALTLASGRNIDLLNPRLEDISFPVICEHLAKINRFCGATPGIAYSVAQHSVIAARAAYIATGDRQLTAYLLVHDMHEHLIGDDTTPKKRTLAAIIGSFGVLSHHIARTFDRMVDRIDTVIHTAAGLPWPIDRETEAAIKKWDHVLLATEWRDLMLCPPPYVFEEKPLPDVIRPHHHWMDAAREMMEMCTSFLPTLNGEQDGWREGNG